jgi:hypothetical protein
MSFSVMPASAVFAPSDSFLCVLASWREANFSFYSRQDAKAPRRVKQGEISAFVAMTEEGA